MLRSSRYRSFLQGCAFALLLFGLVCKPILGFVGELHAVEHAALAAHVDDHDHGDDHQGDGEEQDHSLGGHGLLHQCGSGASSVLPAQFTLVLASLPATLLPSIQASPPPRQSLTSPFRPPIA